VHVARLGRDDVSLFGARVEAVRVAGAIVVIVAIVRLSVSMLWYISANVDF
jgi:hypothetical protein